MAVLRLLAVLAVLLATTQAQNFPRATPQAGARFNFFDVELLKEIISQEGAHNFVVSPASAKAVLAMILEGAEGKTAQEIEKALRLNGNRDHHRAVFSAFLRSLKVRYPGSVVEFANQIFVSPQTKVKDRYKETLEKIYLSGAENLDFTNVQLAAATINGWVSRHTHGIIRTLVPPQALDPHTKAMVANALYFRGKWAVPFDPRATTIRCFYPERTTCQNAYFMETEGHHGYAHIKDLNAKVLELQYQGSKFSMIFLLPNNDIEELLRDLSYHPLNSIIPKLEYTTVVVSIPRFAIEFDVDLTSSLTKLGIKSLFTPAANLSGMVEREGSVFISKVLQKAVIQIDEEGTVGASATGAIAVPLQGPTLPKFEATRPFLFFVRDMETGNYLFEGLVEQPELARSSGPISPLPANVGNGGQPSTPLNMPQPNGHTVLTPVTGFQNNPLGPKIEDVPPADHQPTSIPPNGASTATATSQNPNAGLATAASTNPATGGHDFISYPQ